MPVNFCLIKFFRICVTSQFSDMIGQTDYRKWDLSFFLFLQQHDFILSYFLIEMIN